MSLDKDLHRQSEPRLRRSPVLYQRTVYGLKLHALVEVVAVMAKAGGTKMLWKNSMMVLVIFLLCSMIHHSEGLLINVCSSETEATNCSLEYYSQNIPRENNMVFILAQGTHFIQLNHSIEFEGLQNLSIVGVENFMYVTTVECVGHTGLVFSNINGLYVSNFALINCGETFMDSSTTAAALVMRETSNVILQNLTVRNSKYYGMFGLNMFGYSLIRNSQFSSNFAPPENQPGGNILLSWSPHNCFNNSKIHFEINNSTVLDGISSKDSASGLHIDYHHSCNNTYSSIAITNCTFQGNNGGNIKVVAHQDDQSCKRLFQLHMTNVYIVGGTSTRATSAGGMSFLVSSNNTNASLLSDYYIYSRDSVFTGNANNHASGGVHVETPLTNWGNLLMEFINCTFTNNSGFAGGAIGLQLADSTSTQLIPKRFESKTKLVISSSVFHTNHASQGGAIFITNNNIIGSPLLKSGNAITVVDIDETIIQENVAFETGSALVVSNSFTQLNPMKVNINNSVIQQNEIFKFNGEAVTHPHEYATLVIENSETIIESCSFLHNVGSAIHAMKSELYFSKHTSFTNNRAFEGGAIKLSTAKIYLTEGTRVIFENNLAYRYGGAVYVEENSLQESVNMPSCFVTSTSFGSSPGELPQMIFSNNTATYSGGTVYGSIDSCIKNNDTAAIFKFRDLEKLSTSLSSTFKVNLCMCNLNNTLDCNENNKSINVFSGGKFFLMIAVIYNSGDIIPSVISAKLQTETHYGTNTTILLNGDLQMTKRSCTTMNFTISSNATTEILTLSVVDYSMVQPLHYVVHLLPCPAGFSVQKNSTECKCVPEIVNLGVVCNIDDQTFEHNGNIWIGTYNDSAVLSNDTDMIHALISSTCPYGYCKLGRLRHTLEDADKQCACNHSGIICGGCLPGLSTSLGPPHCIDCESMRDWHTALFVFLFSVLGILLIAFLRLCNLTISQGSANPIIFYANIIHVNGTFFFEQRHSNPLTIFVSWFNLDFGFESCFYNGMDATAKAWLQFVFPLYLWIMIIIIYLVSKQSTKFVRLMGRNCHSVILTLLHLSFFKLYRATIAVLLYTNIQNDSGEHFKVWRYDGNIKYLSKAHTPLFAFASIVLMFFIIPYISIIIFTPLIVRKGYQIRCVNFWRLKPFFDAYTGLYKDRAMFWNGLTAVIFTILVIISTEVDTFLNLVIISISSLFLLFLNFAFGGVYRNWTLSIIEASIHTNMACLSILCLLSIAREQSVLAVTYTSTTVTLIVFTGLVIFQSMKELSRVSKTIQNKLSKFIVWCMHESDKNNKSKECQCYYRNDSEPGCHSDKSPYILDYYQLVEKSTGRYYDTVHRDGIVTEDHVEEDIDDLPLVPAAINPSQMQHSECDQSSVLPKNNNAITFSIVALEDAEEEEGGEIEVETEKLEKKQGDWLVGQETSSCDLNEATSCSNIQNAGLANSESEISEIRIDIDENAPLLSPCSESPQSVKNYLTFETEKAAHAPEQNVCGWHNVHFDQKSLFSFHKFHKNVSTYCPLDSDTEATGQRPSVSHLVNNKELNYMQRMTDPVEVAIVDEGDSDQNVSVNPKIYQQSKLSKKKPQKLFKTRKPKHSRRITHHFDSAFGSQTVLENGEEIPLLTLREERHVSSRGAILTNPETGIDSSTEEITKLEEKRLGRCENVFHAISRSRHTLSRDENHQLFDASSSTEKSFPKTRSLQDGICTAKQTVGSQLAESVPFLKPIEVISVTSQGAVYSCEEYGVSVKIPEGAIPPSLCTTLEIGIAPHGPFEFPPGTMPISPILWICMQHNSQLLKPVEIKLPHCLTDLSEDDSIHQEIGFLKANHCRDYTVNSNGRKIFQFTEAEGKVSFPDPMSAVLTTKDFCLKCLKVNVSPESARKRGYSLIYTIPKSWPRAAVVSINVGITYFLQACIDTFKKQIKDPDIEYDFHTRRFHFKDPSQPVKLVIAKDIKDWIVIVQDGEEGITMEEVDFWNKDESLLETMEYNNAYPPRFVLSVCKNGARTASVARLQFEGTMECVKVNIILQHLSQGSFHRKLNSEGASSEGSLSSMQQMDVIASDLESAGEDEVLCREPELADFMNLVANNIPMKWEQLGVQLRLEVRDLDQIKTELLHEASSNLSHAAHMKLFTRWKKVRSSAFAWASLIVALRTPALNEQTLAKDICAKLNSWYA